VFNVWNFCRRYHTPDKKFTFHDVECQVYCYVSLTPSFVVFAAFASVNTLDVRNVDRPTVDDNNILTLHIIEI